MSEKNLFNALYIVAGAGGVLGEEFTDKLSMDASACVVACSRKPIVSARDNLHGYISEACHFLGEFGHKRSVYTPIRFPVLADKFSTQKPVDVTLIYPIGPFEFDAQSPNPAHLRLRQINPKIYGANVVGLRNYLVATYDAIRTWNINAQLRVVCFDSISNRQTPYFWQSYSASKSVLRRYLRRISNETKDRGRPLSVLMVSTSTINTGAENNIRPMATEEEKAGWLKTSDVVDRVMKELTVPSPKGIKEISLFVPQAEKPDYNSVRWFQRWQRQMGADFG